jgi:hypothetical protein
MERARTPTEPLRRVIETAQEVLRSGSRFLNAE